MRIPLLDSWISSGDATQVTEALSYISKLWLRQYENEILYLWHISNPDIRQRCLSILISWNSEKLPTILSEALSDNEPTIISLALTHLSQIGFPEAFPALRNMLRNNQGQFTRQVLKAIAASGHRSSCEALMEFAIQKFESKNFAISAEYDEAAISWKSGRQDYLKNGRYEEERGALNDLEHRKRDFLSLFRSVCEAMGEAKCSHAVPWLLEFVSSPRRMGLDRDAFPDFGEYRFDSCYSVFQIAAEAMGEIGSQEALPTLLQKLESVGEDYQEIIINALGEIGDPAASTELAKYLDHVKNPHMYDRTVYALGQTGAKDAFDKLAANYVKDPLSDSGRWTAEALVKIDVKKFENTLLTALQSEANQEFKDAFLFALLPIATTESAQILFPLLKDPVLSNRAAWILSNLSNDLGVSSKAKTLTKSQDSIEKAAAIFILNDYYLKHLSEIEQFEGSAEGVEVRRAVTSLYEVSSLDKSTSQICRRS